jgi:hypothetical protein
VLAIIKKRTSHCPVSEGKPAPYKRSVEDNVSVSSRSFVNLDKKGFYSTDLGSGQESALP